MTIKCADCGKPVDELAIFPGKRCLDCHAKIENARPLPTAEELAGMFRSAVKAPRARRK